MAGLVTRIDELLQERIGYQRRQIWIVAGKTHVDQPTARIALDIQRAAKYVQCMILGRSETGLHLLIIRICLGGFRLSARSNGTTREFLVLVQVEVADHLDGQLIALKNFCLCLQIIRGIRGRPRTGQRKHFRPRRIHFDPCNGLVDRLHRKHRGRDARDNE